MNGQHSALATRTRSQNARKAQAVSMANRLKRIADRIEDLEFMARHGAGLEEAASRAGFTSARAVTRFLHRHHRHDLYARLQEPAPARLRVAVRHGRVRRAAA